MSSEQSFQVNAQKVVSETVAGETIVINLETGTYYSLNESASFLWGKLADHYTVDELSEACVARYGASQSVVEVPVRSFIDDLVREQLILSEEVPGVKSDENEKTEQAFVPPAMEIYSDMQEMLLADPIHDVDATGWPKLKSDNE